MQSLLATVKAKQVLFRCMALENGEENMYFDAWSGFKRYVTGFSVIDPFRSFAGFFIVNQHRFIYFFTICKWYLYHPVFPIGVVYIIFKSILENKVLVLLAVRTLCGHEKDIVLSTEVNSKPGIIIL